MDHCWDDGALRAMLDGELAAQQQQELDQHLAACDYCRGRSEALRGRATEISRTLAATPPEAARAYAAFAERYRIPAPVHSTSRRTRMHHSQPASRTRLRGWIAGATALVLAAVLLALPPVRAAADQLLLSFRVQSVMFVPISEERMQELQNLDLDGKRLFLAEPTGTLGESQPQAVARVSDASAAIGVPFEQPSANGLTATGDYSVREGGTAQFQIDIASAREILRLTGVTDVDLPDALGTQPIQVAMSPMAQATYTGNGYTVSLTQGRSPEVTLPDGVDMAQLGRAALRVLGMAPEQADALSRQIDWSSTLVFPFPANVSTIRQVSVNGVPGLLVSGGERSAQQAQLYWQRGDHFYVMELSGDPQDGSPADQLLSVAQSVR